MTDWTDRIAGARMQVDQQFQDRVLNSQFSNQQWGLIMTAVEWEIRDADDPDAARLVADTSHFEDIIPELDRVQKQMGAAAGQQSGGGDGGIVGGIVDFLGSLSTGAGGGDESQLREAEALVADYARELQGFLEKHERWDDVREAAAEE